MSFPWANEYKPSHPFMQWMDEKLPVPRLVYNAIGSGYPVPRNLNYFWNFGFMALACLAIQILTGVILAMHYAANAGVAFDSVEHIMRDVNWGWLLRYTHANGASAFFVVVYLHMFRGLLYGSYRKPRELIWIFGTLIFLALMAEAFMGYLLPWGQMSYWGAQVIVNLFSAIPIIGSDLSLVIRGDFVVSDATLNRFFSFHVIAVPLVLIGLVAAHIIALHEVGSNNPDGVEIKKKKGADGIPLDGIPFHPYYSVKDTVGVVAFLFVFSAVVFFLPEGGGYFLEFNNFFPADPLKTPPHIAPVWYFTPFYSMLRAVTYPLFGLDAKFWGVIAMGAGVVIIAFLPWLDRSPVKSIRYKGPIFKTAIAIFVVCFLILGYLGVLPPTPARTLVSQICSALYFGFFLLMPWYSKLDKCKPEPERVNFK